MSDDTKSLLALYVAMGADLSEDGESVTVPTGGLKPVDIVVRVYPTQIRMERPYKSSEDEVYVTFGVIVDPTLQFKVTPVGVRVEEILHNAAFEIPADQIRLYKE